MFDLKLGDCIDLLSEVADNSVDLILTDLPYGSTACEWDSIINLQELWVHYKRVIKQYHPIVLTASQPFTTVLAASNLEWFKYEWIWVKNRPTNFAHAKNKPMKRHENILVFSEGTTVHITQSLKRMPYYPPTTSVRATKHEKKASEITDAFFSARDSHGEFERNKTDYPSSVLEFDTDQLGLHPTAKPIALFEFLIKVYTKPGEIVFDSCVGSGTTGIACANTDRQFIGMEKDSQYYEMSLARITEAYEQQRELKERVADNPFITLKEEVIA